MPDTPSTWGQRLAGVRLLLVCVLVCGTAAGLTAMGKLTGPECVGVLTSVVYAFAGRDGVVQTAGHMSKRPASPAPPVAT